MSCDHRVHCPAAFVGSECADGVNKIRELVHPHRRLIVKAVRDRNHLDSRLAVRSIIIAKLQIEKVSAG